MSKLGGVRFSGDPAAVEAGFLEGVISVSSSSASSWDTSLSFALSASRGGEPQDESNSLDCSGALLSVAT